MEHLPSKTPDMVRKDFYVHLLAYNLIRTVQQEASKQHTIDPLALSFCATIQHLSSFSSLLAQATEEQRVYEYTHLIFLVSTEKLPIRPNRVEPRGGQTASKIVPMAEKSKKAIEAEPSE